METLKIAVIDTGINIHDKDEAMKKCIKFDKNLQINGICNFKDLEDFHGHGTFCAKTILNTCKDKNNIEIYPIKIFDQRGRTSSKTLLKSLQNIINSDIDIINISASTRGYSLKNELKQICNKLRENEKIIVASHHKMAKENDSFPTVFESVIGVDGSDKFYTDIYYTYNKNKKIQMITNKNDKFIKFNNQITCFGKTSRACSIATGIICNVFNDYGKLKFNELEKVLENQSTNLSFEDPVIPSYKSEASKLALANEILKVIKKYFAVADINLDFLDKYSIFNNFTNINKHNAFNLIKKLNKHFKININIEDIFIYELSDLNKLVLLVENLLNVKY